MSDEGVLQAIMLILKNKGRIGLSDVMEIRGIAGDIQARRCLDKGVQRGLLARAQGGGFIIGGYP